MTEAAVPRRPVVLFVEDEVLVALDLADQMSDMGYDVMGPYHNAATALAALDEGALPDMALLDFNLGRGTTSKPIADALRDAAVPVIFLTGYSATDVMKKQGLSEFDILSKPVSSSELKTLLDAHRDIPPTATR
jgi:DNA-binding response OmpR family regulator